ncbi:hypothetical protein DL771_000057 [Monosporascus sp. 5C6A]|nr:hypothetical protein DL771_000057 [Monosporascus sp. 5C6A]
MVIQNIAPYGEWESPITVGSDGLKDRLPPEYSASDTFYEYGGAAFDVMSDGRLMFSNKDNTVHVLDPDRGEVLSAWVLAVEEDHEHDTPDQVKNYVVAINGDTGKVRRIASGADFYYTPQFSPDRTKVAWLEWNDRYLPFNAAKLVWCDWLPNAEVDNVQALSDFEGAVEPRWGPDGTLYYGREINGQTYCPPSTKHLIAAAVTRGAAKLVLIDLREFSWSQLAEPTTLSDMTFDAMARLSKYSALVIGSGTVTSQALYRIHIDEKSPKIEAIRKSSDEEFDPAYIPGRK